MRFIADLHIHSHYSRATSKEMNLFGLARWSRIKGTNVVGTGDFTHPEWFKELETKLEAEAFGTLRLKEKYRKEAEKDLPETCRSPIRFILTVEISTIYSKGGKVRKVHSVVFAPSLDAAAKINNRLSMVGNLRADGRPILGLDAKELLKIVLDVSEDCLLVPAHAWTPHFSVFGSNSGFDSLEECFEELTPHIYAIETGLSSDPAMNWRLSSLDKLALISNSDAHSPRKLGREANIFDTEISYRAITDAIKKNDRDKFKATIEFFPEEGKYHLDGHRNCGVSMEPEETKRRNGICPKCGRRVTVGVMHRVSDLADRPRGYKPENSRPFYNIVPLPEIIAEIEGVGPRTKTVDAIYNNLIENLGNEFSILLDVPIKDIEKHSSPILGEAVRKMREGKISISAGYDGEYGKISIFGDKEKVDLTPQGTLFN
jgi:uncharacterized protein (TIGR00375 family)